jgi:hypothetical protein
MDGRRLEATHSRVVQALGPPKPIPLVCSTPQLEKFINEILVASSRLLRNDMGLESRNIRDTDELVARMGHRVELSGAYQLEVVTRSDPFPSTNILIK